MIKIVSKLLHAVCIILFLAAGFSLKAEEFSAVNRAGDTIHYRITSSSPATVGVTYCRSDAKNPCPEYLGAIEIPVTVSYRGTTYTVTSIENRAFENCHGLTAVTIPPSVTSIGSSAFSGCSSLASVALPPTVATIGYSAFEDCSSLATVDIPSHADLTSIGEYAFANCNNLAAITIPSSVSTIGHSAFFGCSSLATVTIPSNSALTAIESFVFTGCSQLAAIAIPASVETISYNAFYNCSRLATVDIPSHSVLTTIGSAAFENCNSLLSISLPASVSSIGNSAFSYCSSLSAVHIPAHSALTSIGYAAFFYCSNLSSVYIPDSVTAIGNGAFYKVRSITYNGAAVGAPWGGLSRNNYEEGLLFFSDSAKTRLLGCSTLATAITIPASVISIEQSAFEDCHSLADVTIPSSVTWIGNSAFRDCDSLATISLPSSITAIGHSAFRDCNRLTAVTIPSSVSSIGDYAFKDCLALDTVTIESSCTLPSNLFAGCSIDCLILLQETPPTLSTAHTLSGISDSTIIYVPCTALQAYRTDSTWGQFSNYYGLRLYPDAVCDSLIELDIAIHHADTTQPQATSTEWQVEVEGMSLVIEGAEGKTLHIYDAWGQLLRSIARAKETERCTVPEAGLYIVTIEGGESKRITVQK